VSKGGHGGGEMSATPSTMLELGTALPPFRLPRLGGGEVSSSEFDSASALLVVFICPHCPFMKHIRHELGRFSRDYMPRGLAMVGVNSNDEVAYPHDGWDGMQAEAEDGGYAFPYLKDDTQAVAKAYRAACTPDFFLFDGARRLVYRGQFDSSRPRNPVPVTGADLRAACDTVLAGQVPSADQRSSIGCNIKWKPGNEPEYFVRS
jgi:peroxiredoxin